VGVEGREVETRGVVRRWEPPRWLLVSVPGGDRIGKIAGGDRGGGWHVQKQEI